MLKHILAAIAVFISFTNYAQNASSVGVWLDHLPYSNAVDVIENDNLVYCATEQGLFIYDNNAKTIERLSKVNGLSDVGLTCLARSDKHNLLLIGYSNGNIDLVEGERVTNVPEINLSANYSGLKRINNIAVAGDFAYFCTEFGIVQYDLVARVVRETFIIGLQGDPVNVTDVVLTPDSMYAATPVGLLQASLQDQLINFENWSKSPGLGEPINEVAYFNSRVMANKVSPPDKDSIFYRENNEWKYASEIIFMANVRDLRADKGLLLVSNGFSAMAYRPDFTDLLQHAGGGNGQA
ncbi:MAG: hypothetical protein U5L96_15690 [Owenweeksia sp.]|nr:hypothetical protein [Owenweeksia sp.]